MKRLPLLSAFALLPFLATPSDAQTPAAPQIQPKHLVFAHYMLCFGNSVEFYKQEIELAQRSGIDGFALNAGEWLLKDGKPGNYVTSGERMYQAAKELNSGFKLFFSPDMTGIKDLPRDMGDMVNRFKDHPNQLKRDGKVVMSGWSGQPSNYTAAAAKVKESGTEVFLIPFVSNKRHSANWSPEIARTLFDGQPQLDGVFYFGVDGIYPELIRTNSIGTRVSHSMGKLFMAGIAPAYNSPNLRDFRGLKGYAAMWEGLIQDGADWVELVTWNDYNEDSNLMPYRWPGGAEKGHISRDEGFLDVTSYYSAWFKSGVRPEIKQDKLYYTYRNRSKDQTRGYDVAKKKWTDFTKEAKALDQIHDDVRDDIYVTTFLTAPAEVTITQGKTVSKFQMEAGVNHVAVPMVPGTPRFTLKRGNTPLLDFAGRKLIIAAETEENSPMGYHQQNRTWGGAGAVGSALRLEAENGTLSGDATVVKDGAVTAVSTLAKDGSGVSIPVNGLKAGIYNVRLRYSNPAPTEARLTLRSDGVPRVASDVPNFIPAYLPPTGTGKYDTTSFFWSMHPDTSFLKLVWLPGQTFSKPAPEDDDRGAVRLDAIELVPVAPVDIPATKDESIPELVTLPGGTFTMGSTTGARDEKPTHAVTLGNFQLGKTEITNLQFEQFSPSHKSLRDELSWRDNDPVIYVSWRDAAGYCNWLSQQKGLTPAYDEKTWLLIPNATGYRLPSEAEWEYAASGRGENRRYPWGNAVPDTSRGNFMLNPPGSPGLPANYIGPGTTPVGSFPAGASRDGILDLAGNVGEWCADYYQDYAATPQTNPLNETVGPYRVIRGNSWGYYGGTPHASNREFNSPGYPGYIYLGFRVARPLTTK